MTFWYTAIAPFTPQYHAEGHSWNDYTAWYGLPHLEEMISLDSLLNPTVVEPDFNSSEDWAHIICDSNWLTGFYDSPEYVLQRINSPHYHLLAVVKEPNEPCHQVQLDGFEFIGYDLLDEPYSISTLTNCTGMASTLIPTDFNKRGLLSDYNRAVLTQKEFIELNPNESHARCHLMAVWLQKFEKPS